jgi:hypothetical protein
MLLDLTNSQQELSEIAVRVTFADGISNYLKLYWDTYFDFFEHM